MKLKDLFSITNIHNQTLSQESVDLAYAPTGSWKRSNAGEGFQK